MVIAPLGSGAIRGERPLSFLHLSLIPLYSFVSSASGECIPTAIFSGIRRFSAREKLSFPLLVLLSISQQG